LTCGEKKKARQEKVRPRTVQGVDQKKNKVSMKSEWGEIKHMPRGFLLTEASREKL